MLLSFFQLFSCSILLQLCFFNPFLHRILIVYLIVRLQQILIICSSVRVRLCTIAQPFILITLCSLFRIVVVTLSCFGSLVSYASVSRECLFRFTSAVPSLDEFFILSFVRLVLLILISQVTFVIYNNNWL